MLYLKFWFFTQKRDIFKERSYKRHRSLCLKMITEKEVNLVLGSYLSGLDIPTVKSWRYFHLKNNVYFFIKKSKIRNRKNCLKILNNIVPDKTKSE